MSKYSLDDILNSVSIALDIDGLEFRLVPMPSRAIAAWNRIMFSEATPRDGETITITERLDHNERQREKQLALLADHFRACLTNGSKSKVTPKWLGDAVPQTVLQDLAEYFVEGKRPEWAGERGN